MNLAASPLSFEVAVGSYRLHRVLAEGEVAIVHEAAHLVLPRRAAVKVLRPDLATSPQAAQRLLREACVLEAFGHDGIVRVFDTGLLADGRPWMAMELVGGEPLTAMFARVGPLPIANVVELLTGLVDVIAAAHRSGIVHRALSPAHVLVGGGGDHGVRVLGWGLARQPGGSVDLLDDRRADIYAIGAMAYQAATGQPPFIAVPPVARVLSQFHAAPAPAPVRTLRPEVTPPLAAIIESMLAADPTARPTAADVLAGLDALERAEAIDQAQAAPAPEHTPLPLPLTLEAETVATPADEAAAAKAPEPPTPADPADRAKAEADRDWQQLVALGSPRRPWSSRHAPRLAARAHLEPRSDRRG
ncbi:MAG TPA: serine/threonine-protein kinase [Kofleriaceae bacterium]|nr:serine/threonine-protein kinase [Kofleriaceae bacterium]